MDKLIELFNELEVSESTLLDIISDEKQSIDITLAALISLLDLWVGDVTDEDFYEYTGIAFDTLLAHISQYSIADEDEAIKNSLYRGILKHTAENLNTIYSDDPEAIQGDLKGFFNAYADAVKPKTTAVEKGTQQATSQGDYYFNLFKNLESLGLDTNQISEVLLSVANVVMENGEKEAEWDWPIINQSPVTSDDSSLNSSEFRDRSALRVFGYSVAKTSDWSTETRHRFLSDFMRMELPKVIEEEFGTEYGSPLTTTRLRKVANLLANQCSLRIRRDPDMFSVAIENWETDLEFLKTTFYEGEGLKFTPWPDPRDMEY